MRNLILTALLLLTAACAAPPVAVTTNQGIVRAHTRAKAEQVASYILAFAPDVRQRLEATRTELPEIWVVTHGLGDAGGACYGDRIELRETETVYPYATVHELVHWYVHGSAFDGLPGFLEEGLAYNVAYDLVGYARLDPDEIAEMETTPVTLAHLYVSAMTLAEMPSEEKEGVLRLGFDAVHRLGLDRLKELAEAHVGARAFLRAAGLELSSKDGRPNRANKRIKIRWIDAQGNPVDTMFLKTDEDGDVSGEVPPGAVRLELDYDEGVEGR